MWAVDELGVRLCCSVTPREMIELIQPANHTHTHASDGWHSLPPPVLKGWVLASSKSSSCIMGKQRFLVCVWNIKHIWRSKDASVRGDKEAVGWFMQTVISSFDQVINWEGIFFYLSNAATYWATVQIMSVTGPLQLRTVSTWPW